MPVKKGNNMGLGLINRKFPIWELGADIYWHSSQPFRVQSPGGSGQWKYVYDSVGDSADYYVWDQGKQQLRLVDYSTPEFPPNGFCPPDRTNLWDSSNLQDRGFQTFDAGLTKTNPAMSGTHILDVNSLSWTSTLQVSNTTGSAIRFARDEALNATLNRVMGVLVKQPNGQPINSGVCHLTATDDGDLTGANQIGETTYNKIRSDGWYMASATYTANGTTDIKMFGIELEPGKSIIVEHPTLAGTNTKPQAFNFQPPDIGTADEQGIHKIQIAKCAAGGTTREVPGTAGWFGLTVVNMYNNAASGIEMPFGLYLNLSPDTNNFLRAQYSTSTLHHAIELDSNAVSESFLNHPDPPTIEAGSKDGIVCTWGRYGTTDYIMYFLNGEIMEVDTTFNMILGTPQWWDIGWDNTTNSREPAACIQHVAIGHNLLSRTAGRQLSKWFQNQGLHGSD